MRFTMPPLYRRRNFLLFLVCVFPLYVIMVGVVQFMTNTSKDRPNQLHQPISNLLDHPQAITHPPLPPARAPPRVVAGDRCPKAAPRNITMGQLDANEIFNDKHFLSDWKSGHNSKPPDPAEEIHFLVVPFSHVDPGWLQTMDEYYEGTVSAILEHLLYYLPKQRNMTFMWTEVVFLSMWWDKLSSNEKLAIRKLVSEGRLEISGGGWVMPDEATTDLYALVDQFIEGHQWIMREIPEASPVTSWSIDPFGYSSTLPYLISAAGINGVVINRIHHKMRNLFKQSQNLDFVWSQPWAPGEHDVIHHVMPFHYSIYNQCGSNGRAHCENIDFGFFNFVEDSKEIQSSSCPVIYQQIQDRKKMLKHNVVMMVLGDDFRYRNPLEWEMKYKGFQVIFDCLREKNVHGRFGTVSDYFKLLNHQVRLSNSPNLNNPPVRNKNVLETVTGDFFPYADRIDEYWTGYYTTRPRSKRYSRYLQERLRSAEILHSIAWLATPPSKVAISEFAVDAGFLIEARRNLGLFQHHDAITGTEKPFVVRDYGGLMTQASDGVDKVLSRSFSVLSNAKNVSISIGNIFVAGSQVFGTPDLTLGPHLDVEHNPKFDAYPQTVAVFNSLAQSRFCVVKILSSKHTLKISDEYGQEVAYQVNPSLDYPELITEKNRLEIIFIVYVEALSIRTYVIDAVAKESLLPKNMDVASITVSSEDDVKMFTKVHDAIFPVKLQENGAGKSNLSLENSVYKLDFSPVSGKAVSLSLKTKHGSHIMPFGINFRQYMSDGSGAYLFQTFEPSKPFPDKKSFEYRVVRGKLMSSIWLKHPDGKLLATISMYHHHSHQLLSAIDVVTDLEIRPLQDCEVILRIDSGIPSGRHFYTDLNGFQMMRRLRNIEKRLLPSNYYPITNMAYIENPGQHRLTIVVNQAHGASSMEEGELEVMLDRRLSSDDSRGLGEGVVDIPATRQFFRILVEEMSVPADEKDASLFPTRLAALVSRDLNNPPTVFTINYRIKIPPKNGPILSGMRPWPCDLHLMNLKHLLPSTNQLQDRNIAKFVSSAQEFALIMHHQGVVSAQHCVPPEEQASLNCSVKLEKVTINSLLKNLMSSRWNVTEVRSASLTLLKKSKEVMTSNSNLLANLKPIELKTYSVMLKQAD